MNVSLWAGMAWTCPACGEAVTGSHSITVGIIVYITCVHTLQYAFLFVFRVVTETRTAVPKWQLPASFHHTAGTQYRDNQ